MVRPRIAITLGDPRGIGPEVVAKSLAMDDALPFDPVIVGPTGCGLAVGEAIGEWPERGGDVALAGALAGQSIVRATELAVAGRVDAICTAPIDKQALLAGGYDYPGHTEMLAALTGSRTVMMLASERLRVVLITTHIPLRDVHAALTHEVIVATPVWHSARSIRMAGTAGASATRTPASSPLPPGQRASRARSRPTRSSSGPCEGSLTPCSLPITMSA
jgi:4-hydroxythreonine-4-phosphate dehydrogenase